MRQVLVLISVLATVQGGAVPLTTESFETEVRGSGKNAFVKFFAPWCGHCKAMAPAWGELGDEYADSNSVVIGDVDCTADDTKEICEQIGVKGYPTVKYFNSETPEDGEAYNGGRTVDELKTFVEESLSKHCDIADTLSCTDQEVAYIEKMRLKSGDDVAKELARLDNMLKTAKMAADKKSWMVQRLSVLKQM